MLTERQLEDILKIFLERAQGVNEEYLIAMGDHLREIGELIPSDINRLVQMKRMNANLDAAKKEIARIAEISAEDLAKAFAAAAELDARFVAESFNNETRISVANNAAMRQILTAQFEETYGAMKNLSQTTIETEGYRKAVDKGIQAVQSGMEDYNKAIRRALSEAAGNGLRVTYPSGRTMRLDSAVRQNVLDGIRALNNNVLEQAGREFGADGIEISAHALCAEDHLPYQGKQYSNAEFAKLQDKLPRPFGMWNCKHSMHPILLGISEPAYTEEELAAYRANSKEKITIDGKTMSRYEWTQQQRKIETAVRYEKDKAIAAKAAGDNVLRRECQRNINALQKKYEQISKAAGIKTEFGRMRVEGFKAVGSGELKNRENDDILEMNRRAANAGVFSVLPERMSKKHVREIAKEAGISLKGITLMIDADEEKMKDNFRNAGRADSQTIGRIDLFPKAFASKEELTRTIYHEVQHVRQFKEFGAKYVQDNRRYFEDITSEAEETFIESLKKEGLL